MVIKLRVISLEENTANLETEKKEKIVWPKKYLSENVKQGSILYFSINLEEEAGKDNKNLAKEILNEIIGGKK